MKIFAVFLALSISNAYAVLNMKPGLWEVKTKMKSENGQQDPTEKMRQAMAKMSSEQRKKMEAMMGKSGMNFASNGAMQVCYTNEMLAKSESLMGNRSNQCTHKFLEQTPSKVRMEFNCKDGAKGTGEWKMVNDRQYQGRMNITNSKGKSSEINHEAKYISSDCGNVKPLGSFRK